MPPLHDLAAVAAWRSALHAAWGEVHEVRWPHEVHREAVVGGVPCLIAGRDTDPTLIYVHGGAFVLGSPEVAIPITARLAAHLRVISLGYRLAPEHPFPAALEDVLAACCVVGESGPYALAGDSAGAGLALAAAQSLHARSEAEPCAVALLCPYVEMDGTNSFARAYLGATDPADARVSPLRGVLAGLPPLLVQTGTADALHGQALQLAQQATTAGTLVALEVWQDLWHTWQYHRDIPESDAALLSVRNFVARHCRAAH